MRAYDPPAPTFSYLGGIKTATARDNRAIADRHKKAAFATMQEKTGGHLNSIPEMEYSDQIGRIEMLSFVRRGHPTSADITGIASLAMQSEALGKRFGAMASILRGDRPGDGAPYGDEDRLYYELASEIYQTHKALSLQNEAASSERIDELADACESVAKELQIDADTVRSRVDSAKRYLDGATVKFLCDDRLTPEYLDRLYKKHLLPPEVRKAYAAEKTVEQFEAAGAILYEADSGRQFLARPGKGKAGTPQTFALWEMHDQVDRCRDAARAMHLNWDIRERSKKKEAREQHRSTVQGKLAEVWQ